MNIVKKILFFLLTAFTLIFLCFTSFGQTQVNIGDTVNISTSAGSFTVTIDNVHIYKAAQDTSDSDIISLQCVVENISYKGTLSLSGVDSFIRMTDDEGFYGDAEVSKTGSSLSGGSWAALGAMIILMAAGYFFYRRKSSAI